MTFKPLFVAIAIFLAPQAVAQTLDQQNTTIGNGFSNINKGNYTIGQSFTAGLSGALTRLDFGLYDSLITPPGGTASEYNSPVSVKILNSSFNILAESVIPAGSIASDSGIRGINTQLNFNVAVTAGSLYYFTVTPTTILPSNYAGNGVIVSASGADTYSGGGVIFYNNNGTVTNTGFANDLSFRTFVTTNSAVPEPATWAMMLIGLGGIGAAMRRGRKVSAVKFA